jgi:hypothetical protein
MNDDARNREREDVKTEESVTYFQVKSYRGPRVTQHTRASDRMSSVSGRRQTLGLRTQ